MRKSKQATAETRESIVHTAAAEFRRNGISETGLSDLMATAGLTHGGFYRHFESKDHLVAEACEAALLSVLNAMQDSVEGASPELARKRLLTRYLTSKHRDNPATGCPLAALGSDLRRADSRTREAASAGYRRLVEIVAAQLDGFLPDEANARATAIVSAMVGSMILSRIVTDSKVSDSILRETRDFLLQHY
jgi:TetR/AcrR family transcriptional regulator, transcriptional repressor for nem operon